MIKEINDENFQEEVIKSSTLKPVIVDFWAPWCGPCQMLGPIMDQISKNYTDKLKIVKINVEDNQLVAETYGIMSIPAVKMFKEGKVISEFLGLKSAQKITEWINSSI